MELRELGHVDQTRPRIPTGHAEYLDDLAHLVPLERDRLLAIHLRFLAFEDWTQGEEFGEDTAHGPEVDGGRVVFGAEEQVGRPVPDRDDDLIAGVQGGKGFVEYAGEAEVADSDGSRRSDHYIRWFEIPVYDPVSV